MLVISSLLLLLITLQGMVHAATVISLARDAKSVSVAEDVPAQPNKLTAASLGTAQTIVQLLDGSGVVLQQQPIDEMTLMVPLPKDDSVPDNAPNFIKDKSNVIFNEISPGVQFVQFRHVDGRIDGPFEYHVAAGESRRRVENTVSIPAAEPNKLNIVVVASGYTTAQMAAFHLRFPQIRDRVLTTTPFLESAAAINIVALPQTADLECAPNCANIDRLMCCNLAAVYAAVNAAGGSQYQEIIVLHNTSQYSGGGYTDNGAYKTNPQQTLAAVYDGEETTQVAIHEFGHSFGNLCDEYAYGDDYGTLSCVNCVPTCEEMPKAQQCFTTCSSRSSYFRPEPSLMLANNFKKFNQQSIDGTYLNYDSLSVRLFYFTQTPATTLSPSQPPTKEPTTPYPTTRQPTRKPTFAQTPIPTKKPFTPIPATKKPTRKPITSKPTRIPTSRKPTRFPTSRKPTRYPTRSIPTRFPSSKRPTRAPRS